MTEVQRLAKIMVLKDMLKEYELLAKYNGGTDYDRYCALDMAIRALEQEPKTNILDKMMTEINEYNSLWVEVESMLEQAKQQVLEIIDKYRK